MVKMKSKKRTICIDLFLLFSLLEAFIRISLKISRYILQQIGSETHPGQPQDP